MPLSHVVFHSGVFAGRFFTARTRGAWLFASVDPRRDPTQVAEMGQNARLPDSPNITGHIDLIRGDLYDFYRIHNRDFEIVATDKESNELTPPTPPSTATTRQTKFPFVLNFETVD
jgi:hypothetical protein